MSKITKEIAKEYLDYCNTFHTIEQPYEVENIYVSPKTSDTEEYYVVVCKYLDMNGLYIFKNVHLDQPRYINWYNTRRNSIIDGLLE